MLIIGLKDIAYYCYCAYLLRISRYLGYLWVVPINGGIFLCSLKLCRESRTYSVASVLGICVYKENWGNHVFFRDTCNKASIWNKNAIHCTLLCILQLFRIIVT